MQVQIRSKFWSASRGRSEKEVILYFVGDLVGGVQPSFVRAVFENAQKIRYSSCVKTRHFDLRHTPCNSTS